jgi:hypothetical protein
MSDRKRLEPYSIDCHWFSQRHPAAITNRIATEQVQRFLGGVHRARSACGKARGMIGMRVREYHRGRRYRAKPTQPVHPAVDHDARIAGANEHRAVAPMPARANLDFTASAKEGQLDCTAVSRHIDPQTEFKVPRLGSNTTGFTSEK